jgi:hypothetical protein
MGSWQDPGCLGQSEGLPTTRAKVGDVSLVDVAVNNEHFKFALGSQPD